ncbi:Hypothetical_protein [Hexamita inflata]|uniref:Hypothetical_protein n=1 Tax=Hexamita inflata TaxID=28002 RepID=A0AA86PNJ1_9EUKA|nr:Hypothetical protein HINF_LOCUS28133 [Hexamita inflata]
MLTSKIRKSVAQTQQSQQIINYLLSIINHGQAQCCYRKLLCSSQFLQSLSQDQMQYSQQSKLQSIRYFERHSDTAQTKFGRLKLFEFSLHFLNDDGFPYVQFKFVTFE